MLVEIEGRRYKVPAMEDLQLRHVAELQHELAGDSRITSLRDWAEIRAALGEWGDLPKAEQLKHPEAMFFTCLTVWAARVMAGDEVSLLEAVSVPARQVRWIVEPSDKQAGEGPGKAPRPASAGADRRGGKRKRR